MAANYQPSSYVTIPLRTWTEDDIVEIIMPFGKHIDYGPDKMETAFTGQNQPNLKFEPMWAGTLMYGPLAMTTTGVNTWDDATLTIDSYLESIVLNGPSGGSTGKNGNLYTLTVGERTFEPDYFREENSTHYFRINIVDDMMLEFKEMLSEKLTDLSVFKSKNYTRSSFKDLRKSIEEGKKLVRSKNTTQKQIVELIALIDENINNLKPRKLDKSLLTSAIKEAEMKNFADYTWDKFQSLEMAVATAKEIEETAKSQILVDKQTANIHKALNNLILATTVDKSYLASVLNIAKDRKQTQEEWSTLHVKALEHSPWAPHGFRRLLYQIGEAQRVYDNKDKNYSQNEVDLAASSLNAVINTMRPGNLPEPEDLYPLSTLLRQADRIMSGKDDPALVKSIEYARMVVEYVNDGSGTHDKIKLQLIN